MKEYLDALKETMDTGIDRTGRNAVTRAIFSKQLRFDLQDGFPAITAKFLPMKSVAAELIWFIEGSTDVNRLKEIAGFDISIWDGDAKQHKEKGKAKFEGDLGPVYGKQWKSWACADGREIDQLKEVIDRIKSDPYDRRLIVTAWNPGEIEDMALPPCHMSFQFFVTPEKGKSEPKYLSLSMLQRSCDMFLGVPFNIASYALLLSMVAQVTGLEPKECVVTLVDNHVYFQHFNQVEELLKRKPFALPNLWLNPEIKNIDDFRMEDIKLLNYEYHPAIKAPLITQDLKK